MIIGVSSCVYWCKKQFWEMCLRCDVLQLSLSVEIIQLTEKNKDIRVGVVSHRFWVVVILIVDIKPGTVVDRILLLLCYPFPFECRWNLWNYGDINSAMGFSYLVKGKLSWVSLTQQVSPLKTVCFIRLDEEDNLREQCFGYPGRKQTSIL